MRKRLTFCISISVAAIMGVGPLLLLASPVDRRLGYPSNVAARVTGVKNDASKPLRPRFISKLLSKRPAQNQTAASSEPGQTATVLQDGRMLRIGGLEKDGPTSIALIGELPVQLQRARAWHTATMLPDGNVLILGGIGADGQPVDTAEIFNPETRTSELLTPALQSSTLNPRSSVTPRVYHTATLLTEGLVLIAGGLSSEAVAVREAELWDFRSKVVSSQARLRTARYNHTASLLQNGKVLLSGGTDDEGMLVEGRELYSPLTRRFSRTSVSPEITPQSSSADPRLVASLPEDGTVDVPVDRYIALRFSKPLRADTVNASTVVLTGLQRRIEAKVIPAENGMLAFLSPSVPLLPGITYSVTLAGASDPGGSLVEQANITFTTAAGIPRGRVWVPGQDNFNGDWTSGFPPSPWQELPAHTGPPGVTALSGQVLRIDGWPLERVILRIGDRSTATDNTGRFLLTDIESGRRMLIVDCRPASTRKETYGLFMIAIDVPKSDETNVLPFTIWMPVLDTKHAIRIASPNKKEVVATTPLLPELEVHIPPKSILRDVDGNALTSITITPIPLDRGPFPGPPGVRFPMFFTLQLGGTKVEAADGKLSLGMRLVFPNYEKTPPGTRIIFWSYAADAVGWFTYGNGTVTDDGKQIVPDPGVTIDLFTCASIGSPTESEGPQDCTCDADPVNLGTGLFVYSQTDLVLPDDIPISLTRIYRPNDPKWRPFGSGTRHPYEIFLVGDQTYYTYSDLILPDGGKIRFNRISPGSGPSGAIMEATTTPTPFYKATLTYYASAGGAAEARWDLRLKDGTVYRFTVDQRETAPLVAIIDRNGNQLSIVRTNDFTGNLQGRRITRIVSPNGRWVAFTYDANFHVTQAKDNIGRTVSYAYDASGRLIQVTDAGGGVTQYTYDAANRMLTIRDARGIVYLTNAYDTNGRITQQTQADSTTYQLAYTLDGNGKVTQTDVTDPRGNHRLVTFNSSGYALTDTKGCSCGSGVTYERQAGTNFVTAMIDALNRRTEYAHDSMGNVSSVTRMAGTGEAVTNTFAYELSFNQITGVTDPLNHSTAFAYDNKGNLNSVTNALNHQTTFSYNSAGQPISATDPLGNTAQFSYDGGDLVSVTSPLGQSVNRFVDAAGRVVSVTNPLGQTARFEYDALNRMTRVTDPVQGVTQFAYDANGNLLSLTDARNNVTSYAYDGMDRLQTRTDPLLHAESYQYNQKGSLTQHTDRKSQVTNYVYDSLDRLSQVSYADGSTISYTYDAASRLTQVTDSMSGTITYSYDNLDRLLSEATPRGTVSYTYDAIGRRTTKTVPTQAVVNYTYDIANRIIQHTQGTSSVQFSYDAASRRASLTLPNGVLTEYTYNAASQLIGLTYKKGGTTLGNLTYEYDVGNRRRTVGGGFARTGLPNTLNTASYNALNQQTNFGGQALAYDLNGNLVSDGASTFTWNARNQLVGLSGSGVIASFQYDAHGRRTSKTINSVTTGYLYDGENLAQEQVGGSASADSLTGRVDELFTRTDASGTITALSDGIGSNIALADSTGVVQSQYTYEPFGKTTATGAINTNSQKYTSREDDGTGLYYYRARYYSPTLQRFISEDPIGYVGGANLYAYARNNPVSYTDAFGLMEKEAFKRNFGDSLPYMAGPLDTWPPPWPPNEQPWSRMQPPERICPGDRVPFRDGRPIDLNRNPLEGTKPETRVPQDPEAYPRPLDKGVPDPQFPRNGSFGQQVKWLGSRVLQWCGAFFDAAASDVIIIITPPDAIEEILHPERKRADVGPQFVDPAPLGPGWLEKLRQSGAERSHTIISSYRPWDLKRKFFDSSVDDPTRKRQGDKQRNSPENSATGNQ